jgi:hypothetical protein
VHCDPFQSSKLSFPLVQVEEAVLERASQILGELLSCTKNGQPFVPVLAIPPAPTKGKSAAKAEKGEKTKQVAEPLKLAADATEAGALKVSMDPPLWKESVLIDAHRLVRNT